MIESGNRVKWKWDTGYAFGTVKETYSEKVTKVVGEHTMERMGNKENPALWIEQDNGSPILKLESEVNLVE